MTRNSLGAESHRPAAFALAVLALVGGCTGISIAPSCPNELRVDESGPVIANEENTGAIAKFLWEATPEDAGTFTDAKAAETTFKAAKAGDVVIRLTASDGLFQVVSQCSTRIIEDVNLAVSLTASSTTATVGDTVTLTCTGNGEGDAVALTIEQVGGDLELTHVSEGVATFTPSAAAELDFRCIGEDGQGRQSDPVSLSISVSAATAPDDDDRDTADDGRGGKANGTGQDDEATDENTEDTGQADDDAASPSTSGGGRTGIGGRG